MNTDKTTSKASAGAESAQVDSVKIEWINDECQDLSWLDQSDKEMGEGFEKQSEARKESYGQSWEMLGCVAKAQISYSIGGGSRRLETLSSGGLWGIESDSDKSYLREIEDEQLADLASHLEHFGIEISASQLRELAD